MKKLIILSIFILSVYACNEHRKDEPLERSADTLEHTRHDTSGNAEADQDNDREEFRRAARERMDRLDRRIDSLEVKWKEKKSSNKGEYEVKRKEARDRSAKLRAKLDSSKVDTKENWQEFKNEFNRDMDELGNRIDNLFDDDDDHKDDKKK